MAHIRLADGSTVNSADWLHWPTYSSVDIADGDTVDLVAFGYVEGAVVPHTTSAAARNSTRSDTNMVRKGRANQDETLIVNAVTYETFALSDRADDGSPSLVEGPAPITAAQSLGVLHREIVVGLSVGANISKYQWSMPLARVGQSIGCTMAAAGDLATIHAGTGGYPTAQNQERLQLPIWIGGTGKYGEAGNAMAFRFNVRSYNALTDLNQNIMIRFWLDTLKRRPS